MLRTFYYIDALASGNVDASLRDRKLRLLFVEALYEMSTLFERVMRSNASVRSDGAQAKTASWMPDTIACTYLSIHALMVLLPLPDFLFNVLLRVVDFGLYSSVSTQSVTAVRAARLVAALRLLLLMLVCIALLPQRDLAANLETSFAGEFKDVFELASNRSMPLPALEFLQTTLDAAAQAKSGAPRIASSVMVSNVVLSPQSRAAARTFLLKVILFVLVTSLLTSYLFIR